jgi:GTPase SAR1 family protein
MAKFKTDVQYDPKMEKHTIVLLGGPAVGKSALTLRMITENFVKEYDPTIEDIYTKKITVDGRECVLSTQSLTSI